MGCFDNSYPFSHVEGGGEPPEAFRGGSCFWSPCSGLDVRLGPTPRRWLKKSTLSVQGLEISRFVGVRLELLWQIWDLLDLAGQLGKVC